MKYEEVIEREADYFARCLLMPREFVIRDIKALGGVDPSDDLHMGMLAKKYQVSISMMAMRVYELSGEYENNTEAKP